MSSSIKSSLDLGSASGGAGRSGGAGTSASEKKKKEEGAGEDGAKGGGAASGGGGVAARPLVRSGVIRLGVEEMRQWEVLYRERKNWAHLSSTGGAPTNDSELAMKFTKYLAAKLQATTDPLIRDHNSAKVKGFAADIY